MSFGGSLLENAEFISSGTNPICNTICHTPTPREVFSLCGV
jgi:hypothetical protein